MSQAWRPGKGWLAGKPFDSQRVAASLSVRDYVRANFLRSFRAVAEHFAVSFPMANTASITLENPESHGAWEALRRWGGSCSSLGDGSAGDEPEMFAKYLQLKNALAPNRGS